MIAALSAADQRRRRTDPVETATPRSSHFASLLPSNITITRSSPLLQAEQASQPLPLKKGARTPLTANRIRRRAPCRGDKWHLDEVVITIAGEKHWHWLWRAVDQQGFVLDVLVQSRRDKKAAKRLLRKLLKKQGRSPRVLITDK